MQAPVVPLPDPELIAEIGLVGYLLMALVLAGIVASLGFLYRLVNAMDRIAAAQEETPPLLTEIRTLISARFDHIEDKVDKAIALSEEHVSIARLWKASELGGRQMRRGPPQ